MALPDCRRSWRETHPDIPPRASWTDRARREAARRVGQEGQPVAPVARAFGVGWQTVMRAVDEVAAEAFADQGIFTMQSRICVALEVDEKVMNRASRGRRRRYVTVLVNLAIGRPIDIVEGRSKRVLKAWLTAQTQLWRDSVRIVALDPAASYRAALTDPVIGLAHATLVVDRFHMHKLANAAIDDVRRRVQQETLGHRGRAGDPLYGIRRLLLAAPARLDARGAARLETALAVGDPYDEVACAWAAAWLLADIYNAPDIFAARHALGRFFDWAADVDVADVTRLAAPWTAGATR